MSNFFFTQATGSMATKKKIHTDIVPVTFTETCVTVLGHSPLSRPVAWRRSSSPIVLGYQRYASTHKLNALQMVALRAAI